LKQQSATTETAKGDESVSVKKVIESNVLGRIIPSDNYQVEKEVGMDAIESILATYGPDGQAKDQTEPIVKVVEEGTFKTGEECIEEELERENKKERKDSLTWIDPTKSQYFSKYPKRSSVNLFTDTLKGLPRAGRSER